MQAKSRCAQGSAHPLGPITETTTSEAGRARRSTGWPTQGGEFSSAAFSGLFPHAVKSTNRVRKRRNFAKLLALCEFSRWGEEYLWPCDVSFAARGPVLAM